MVGSRVYIGNLPKDAGERDLERFFRGYGRIRDVLIKNGYGFVELDDPRDAEDAVYELNGKRLLGERVTVERARGTPRGRDRDTWGGGRGDSRYRSDYRGGGGGGGAGGGGGGGAGGGSDRYGPPTRTDHRLIVENLSSRVSWQDLKDYMRQAGEVTYADAHKYKNEGVVEFASYSDMKNALEKLDDTEINGRRIRLIEDKRRDRKSLSYSSRSRSRSRSRRRSRSASGSRSRSRSRSHRSRSKSKSDRRSKSKSRSASRHKSIEKSKSKSPHSRSRSHSAASKHSKDRSRSRSTSADRKKASNHKSKSRSRSHSRSNSPEK